MDPAGNPISGPHRNRPTPCRAGDGSERTGYCPPVRNQRAYTVAGPRLTYTSRNAEIPYVKFETAIRDVVCSLMERQDRMNEEIFCRINDLVYRVEDLEQDRQAAGGSP